MAQQRRQHTTNNNNNNNSSNSSHQGGYHEAGEDSRTHYFESPPKGKRFELETVEDVREFNDIKVDILKTRGLHSVQVRHSTKVLCGGEFTHVILVPPCDDEDDEDSCRSPQVLPRDKNARGSNNSHSQLDGEDTEASTNLLDTSSSALFAPLVYSYTSQEGPPLHSNSNSNSNRNEEGGAEEQHTVKQFVSELLKNSPMSPQNINYSLMQNTQISNEVKKMIDEFGDSPS
jgi:hypothetical protein